MERLHVEHNVLAVEELSQAVPHQELAADELHVEHKLPPRSCLR